MPLKNQCHKNVIKIYCQKNLLFLINLVENLFLLKKGERGASRNYDI